MTEIKQKYIIKNCPAFVKLTKQCRGIYDNNIQYQYCSGNSENCVIKQVIEKCKDAQSECSCKDPIKDIDCFECTSGGRAELGTEILQLFDIEVLGGNKDENTEHIQM